MIRLGCLLIGYLFGCFQTSYLYCKKHGVDIRKEGSGNAGTNNTLRVMGWKAGAIVFIGDLMKMVAAILVTRLIFETEGGANRTLLMVYTALGVVLGHDFPFYLGFRGGKGIASSGGLALMLDWRIAIAAAVSFFGIGFLTKYVSVGSLSMMAVKFFLFIILSECGMMSVTGLSRWEAYAVLLFLLLLALWQHRANLSRLIHGKENKFHIGGRKQ